MDSRSPSPVSQIQLVEVPSLGLEKNQSTNLTGRQEHFQPQFHTNVRHLTEAQQEKITLAKDSLPDQSAKLSHDVLYRRPSSLSNSVRDFEPPKMLARPSSTGKDINSGFFYQKPTMPALNFSRSPENKSSAHRKPEEDSQKHDSARERRGQVNTSDTVHIQNRDFDIPAGGNYSSNDGQVTSTKPTNDPIKTISPAKDILQALPRGNGLPAPPEAYHDSVTASANNGKSFPDPAKSYGADVSDQTWESGRAARAETQTPDTAVSAPAVNRNKVTKAKQKRRPETRRAKVGAAVQPDPGPPPSEEDLLNLLAYRYKKDCESKANREAILQAKNLEVEELRRNQDTLKRYLAESERNVTLQEKELERHKEAISKKVGKLTKFVNGLAKDHNQLRNDAKLMVEKQTAARADGFELVADIQNVRTLTQDWAKRCAENPGLSIRDARQKIDQLEGTVGILNKELEEKSGLLATERDRTVELEAKIKLTARDHDEVKALMDRHHKGIIEKLNILPDIVETVHANSDPGPVAELRIKVEECLELLKTVHGSSDALPEILHNILGPVQVACGEILASVVQVREDRGVSNKAISTLEASLKEDISALKEDYNGAQGLTKELVILQESQAALTERVHGQEKALTGAQERYKAVQHDKQFLQGRVSALEMQAAASQRESEGLKKALNTLQEAEPVDTEVEAALATAQKEAADLRDKLQEQAGSLADLRDTKGRLESERLELQAAVATLEEEKLVSKQQTDLECNEIRKELAASSKHARDMVVREFENKLHQLTETKKEAERRLESLHHGVDRYKAHISELRENIGEKERLLEVSKEQLQLAAEKANTRDAEIQAIKEDRAANAKVLKQALNNADGLKKRVASLAELNSKFEGEGATLRAKNEKAEKLHERVQRLYHALGLGDGAAPLSMQMVDLLEEKVLALNNQQSLFGTKPHSEIQSTTTKQPQLADAPSGNAKRPRRKVTRHTTTDNRNIREPQTPLGAGAESEVSAVEARIRETIVEDTSFAHRVSSRGTGAASERPIRPYEIDSAPAALIEETQTTGSFVPLWDIEAEAAHVPTSPFTDLSAFFSNSPLSSPKQWASPVREKEPTEHSRESSARGIPPGNDTKVAYKDRVQRSSTPKDSMKDVKTNLERETIGKSQTSRKTHPPSQKTFSPSTGHVSRQRDPEAYNTPSGRTLKEKSKKGVAHIDDESEARLAEPQPRNSTKLPLANHGISGNKNKLTSGRVATQGILKKPIPTVSKKRGLEGAGLQANDAPSLAKRSKREGGASTSSQTANAPPSSLPKPPLPISGRNTNQHPYSPTAKKSGTTGQRRKRSQTSEVDRYELRFRQELA